MSEEKQPKAPWMVAVWPGMGGVAISAGYYLLAKLGMRRLFEFPATDYFQLEQIEVKDGLILNRRLPRSRMFLWSDPAGRRDIIVFIGEAQPPAKGGIFCHRLIDQARKLGVEKVFTFAAMATPMRPKDPSRVFGAAIDRKTLSDFKHLGIQPLENGTISGLNGVLLGMAANEGLPGGCMLGEIPHVFSQIPFPKAALAVLEVFSSMTGLTINLEELREHASKVELTLEDFLVRMEGAVSGDVPDVLPESAQKEGRPHPASHERKRIERLFEEASKDRSRAYELKQELDRLGLFHEFEDRFLDLFKDT